MRLIHVRMDESYEKREREVVFFFIHDRIRCILASDGVDSRGLEPTM